MPYKNLLPGIVSKINGRIALAFSHQAEDVAALHMLTRCQIPSLEVFTLETGKLFPETLQYNSEIEKFFNITITKYFPDSSDEKKLEAELGEFGMRESLEKRHLCCRVRKVDPLAGALSGNGAWVTGLRAAQSVTRADVRVLEYDEKFGLIKINPLADWSEDDVSAYIKEFALPLHPLYSKGFKSIGCAPCTRAVKESEDIRDGRWWWENPEHKECGLHVR